MGVLKYRRTLSYAKYIKIRRRRVLRRIGFRGKKIWARLREAGVPRHKNRPLQKRPVTAMRWSNFWFALRDCLCSALLMRYIHAFNAWLCLSLVTTNWYLFSGGQFSTKGGALLHLPSYGPEAPVKPVSGRCSRTQAGYTAAEEFPSGVDGVWLFMP